MRARLLDLPILGERDEQMRADSMCFNRLDRKEINF